MLNRDHDPDHPELDERGPAEPNRVVARDFCRLRRSGTFELFARRGTDACRGGESAGGVGRIMPRQPTAVLLTPGLTGRSIARHDRVELPPPDLATALDGLALAQG